MRASLTALEASARRGWWVGFLVCLGGPVLILLSAWAGWIPPGSQPVEGVYQQVGYTFTGLVFLASAYLVWRKGHALRAFPAQAEGRQAGFVLRETLVYSALCASSALWGVLYWRLVGWHAFRHALTFLLLTPVLFLLFVPRLGAWTHPPTEDTP